MQVPLLSAGPASGSLRSARAVVAAVGLCALAVAAAHAQTQRVYRVVVHPDNPTPALPVSDLSDLFLGKMQDWPHGVAARIVERPARSQVRSAFTHDTHDRSVDSVQQLWQRLILSGRVQAPEIVDSDLEVLRLVASNPGAVGYVAADTPLAGVRELPVVDVPERIAFQAPRYTEAAHRAGVQGVVLLRLSVDETGSVSGVDVIKDLPMGLTNEAVRTARRWRYEPARMDGRPVAVSFDVAVRFSLSDASSAR